MSTTMPTHEYRELVRRFKRGYTVERTGDGHFRVLDPEGNPVMKRSGGPISLSSTPKRGVTKPLLADLEAAGVFRPTATKSRNSNGTSLDSERAKEAVSVRSRNRRAVASALRARLDAVIEPVGGLDMPGMPADLSFVGADIARGLGYNQMTPDLLDSSIISVRSGNWVEGRYQEIWGALAERLENAEDIHAEFFALVRKGRGIPEMQQTIGPDQLVLQDGDWPFRVELIRLERCLVDHTYQRPVPWPFVRKMALGFDPTLVGTIDVSERGRGATFAILDGQCRYQALRLVGRETVWASIYAGLDIPAEARLFLRKNRERKAVHSFYTFKARVIAGDKAAIEIERVVAKHGYSVSINSAGGKGKPEWISAVGALEDIQKRGTLDQTLDLLHKSTFGRPKGQATTLIRGVGRFFQLNAEKKLDLDRLTSIVTGMGPELLLGQARDRARGSGSAQPLSLARILIEEYNKGLPRHEQLRKP